MPVETKESRPLAGHQRATRALWYVAPGEVALESAALPAARDGEAQVRTLWSALSRGTERLVLEGLVPASEWQRMRAPHQQGDFPYPVKYGYACVGVVEAGAAPLAGQPVFVLHPHQEEFVVPAADLHPLPAGLPPRRAPLAANMETALNALWDSGTGPGDRVAIVGAGLIGLMVAALAAVMPGTEVLVVDLDPSRRALAEAFGAEFAAAGAAPANFEADVVFHASASAAGLATALELAGFEAAIVELSWYGMQQTPVALGGAFHSRRLRLIASQVGSVAPSHRPRWPHARRLAKALELLRDDRFDALITDEIAFADAPAMVPKLLARGAPGLATLLRY